MLPLVSIIVPIFNSEKYLYECVNSILNQTFKDFEVLLIDDGSTDTSPEICNFFASKDRRIRVYTKKNGGVSSARNLGIEKSKAKFVTFIDSDDKVKDTYLSDFNMLKYDADFFLQGGILWTHDEEYKEVPIIQKDNFFPDITQIIEFLEIERSTLEVPWGKLFSSKLIKDNQLFFDESLKNAEDHLFVIKFLEFIRNTYISASTNYFYRKFDNIGSLSSGNINYDSTLYYATSIYSARLNIIHKHNLSKRYINFSERIYVDLILKGIVKLISNDTVLRKEKEVLIETYLNKIENTSGEINLNKIKKFVLIKLIWTSFLPRKLEILRFLIGKK